jgi:hypothetical protein
MHFEVLYWLASLFRHVKVVFPFPFYREYEDGVQILVYVGCSAAGIGLLCVIFFDFQ